MQALAPLVDIVYQKEEGNRPTSQYSPGPIWNSVLGELCI